MQTRVEITDHALVRYLERIHGMDMEFFRDCVRAEIEGYHRKSGIVYMNGISWLYENSKLISVMRGKTKYRDFMENHT